MQAKKKPHRRGPKKIRSNDRRRIAPQSTPPATMAPHGAGANAAPAAAAARRERCGAQANCGSGRRKPALLFA